MRTSGHVTRRFVTIDETFEATAWRRSSGRDGAAFPTGDDAVHDGERLEAARRVVIQGVFDMPMEVPSGS
jgi:hypothetical protein